MIQITDRLSRGARMRRASPIWTYALMIAAASAGAVLLVMLWR